jgi:precorrin-3B C17-methyltransferase
LYIVGIGPGGLDHLSHRAREALTAAETVVGYTTYIDLIRPLLAGKTVVSTGMTREVQRVEQAIDIALAGTDCAMVSSGDAGIYAMAGLVLEMCRSREIPLLPVREVDPPGDTGGHLVVEVVPGIPALCAGAALLGAPLTHDFAAVSLSDLLTPWETIESRIEAAASADFVVVLYNPKSKKRNWQLQRAQEILLRHRHPETPTGIVSAAMRAEQSVRLIPLKDLDRAPVGMQTTVFIGNSATHTYDGFMITPRGYREKYRLAGTGRPEPGETPAGKRPHP